MHTYLNKKNKQVTRPDELLADLFKTSFGKPNHTQNKAIEKRKKKEQATLLQLLFLKKGK